MAKPIPIYSFTSSAHLSPFTVSAADFLTAKFPPSTTTSHAPPYTLLATGSLILTITTTTTDSHSGEPRVLLLQRAPTDSMPLRWEIPGGAVDDDDPSILHACARELFEEAGLISEKIQDVVRPQGRVFPISKGRFVCKFEFLVTVEGTNGEEGVPVVKLDPNEHCAFAWANEEDVRSGEMVGGQKLAFTDEEQRQVVLEAFDAWRRTKAE
jgi:8-oxo-dGTP pyrophosphatase MutT (NUDIX family)